MGRHSAAEPFLPEGPARVSWLLEILLTARRMCQDKPVTWTALVDQAVQLGAAGNVTRAELHRYRGMSLSHVLTLAAPLAPGHVAQGAGRKFCWCGFRHTKAEARQRDQMDNWVPPEVKDEDFQWRAGETAAYELRERLADPSLALCPHGRACTLYPGRALRHTVALHVTPIVPSAEEVEDLIERFGPQERTTDES